MSVSIPGNSWKFSSRNRIIRDITEWEEWISKAQNAQKTGAKEQKYAKNIRDTTGYEKF